MDDILNCSQQCNGSHSEQWGSLRVYSRSKIEPKSKKLSFWGQTSLCFWQDTITGKVLPQTLKIRFILNKLSSLKSKTNFQRNLGLIKSYRDDISRMAQVFNLFCKPLKEETPTEITSELTKTFNSVNKALSDTC